MEEEFTACGNLYYKLNQAPLKREKLLKALLNNAAYYAGETKLSDLNAITSFDLHYPCLSPKKSLYLQLSQNKKSILCSAQELFAGFFALFLLPIFDLVLHLFDLQFVNK